MISKARPLARPLFRSLRPLQAMTPSKQIRCASSDTTPAPEITDPGMNGGYINPPRMKRALRDPYAGWWDEQERRNFGEPVHEDNDILTVFSPEPYTHAPAGRAGFHFGVFVLAIVGLAGVVHQYYPDRPSVARDLPDGLESELGGPGAWSAKRIDTQEDTEEA